MVEGGPDAETGRIDLPLARRSDDPRSWWMKADPAGDPALTHWRVLGRAGGRTWLELKPVTGRTHQLRVHCAASAGRSSGIRSTAAAPRGGSLHLHARTLTIPLYPKREAISIKAPRRPYRGRRGGMGS